MTDVPPQSTDPDDDIHSDSPHPEAFDSSSIVNYTGVPIQMYPFGVVAQSPIRSKRRQVKNACTHCQKACKKCDDARPCLRCVKYGIGEECVDSQRKERKKGVKRGPYKKRDGKTSTSVEQPLDGAVAQGVNVPPPPVHPPGPPPPPGPYLSPVPYSPFYGQYSPMPPPGPKPADMPPYYPSYYVPVPHVAPPHPNGQEHDHAPYPPPQFYPPHPFVSPYVPSYAPSYMIPHRPDMPMTMMSGPYAPYPPPYTRPPSVAGHGPDVIAAPAHMIRREDAFDSRPPELVGMEGRA